MVRNKNGAVSMSTGKKLSREALGLINSQILRYNDLKSSACLMEAVKDKAGNSLGSGPEDRWRTEHYEKNMSAPPVVNHGQELELPERQRNKVAGHTSNHRVPAAAIGAAEDQVREDHRLKQHKKRKSSEQQSQEGRKVGVEGGDAKPTTSADADADAHLAGSKRSKKGPRASKSKDQLAGDAGAKSALTSSIGATDPAVSGHSKKSRKEKKQTAAAALDGQAGPSNPAKERETETGAPQVRSQLEDTVTTQRVATRTETAALTASASPAEERIDAAVGPGPERPGGRQEGTTGLPSAESNPAGPGINAAGLQSLKGCAAGSLHPAAAPVNAGEAGRYFPETGTTPVNAFLPERLPRPEETDAQEKSAIIELQRQLSELQTMYKDLKATKIGQMDKLLAEMAERAEGRVCVAEQLARHWQGVAKRAQEEAIAAGSVETANRIDALEAEANQLLKQNQNLLQRVTQLQLELCHAQQDLHDARAELLQFRTFNVRDLEGVAKDKGNDPHTALQESSPEVTLGGVRSHAITDAAATGGRGGGRSSLSFGMGLQSEMLSPGAREQTTNLSVPLFPVQVCLS
ncbi:hypothetical protein Vafri_409 [Volvox africanus]|nr:hypothetical protein Vafri_409 [Volvox africanus]